MGRHLISVDPRLTCSLERLAWWNVRNAASCHSERVNIATLIVSLVALLIAYLAFRHERAASTAHGMFVTVTPLIGERRVECGTATGIAGWHVALDIVGPVPVVQAQPVLFVDGESSLVASVTNRELVPVWSPGDAPLEVTIVRIDSSALPDEIWVGVTWAEPTPYGSGLISRVRRWPIRLKGQKADEARSQKWSHWGKGRWKDYRHPFWRPRPTNRWNDERAKLGVRE